MSHLTKAEPKGLFSATAPERPNRETGNEKFTGLMPPRVEPPFAVQVDQTPDQAQRLRMAAYPALDWGDVSNLSPRTRGKHY